MSYGTYINS